MSENSWLAEVGKLPGRGPEIHRGMAGEQTDVSCV